MTLSKAVRQRLDDMSPTPTPITDQRVAHTPGTAGERSKVAEFTGDVANRLRGDKRILIALPAYEQFSSDGTGGNTETFNLGHDIIQSPVTDDAIVYIGGESYGRPDSIDYANNSIDVTDPGSNNNVHVFYVPGDAASIEVEKVAPNDTTQGLYDTNAKLLNGTNQHKEPEYLDTGETPLKPWIPGDFRVAVYVDAPYQVAYEDTAGDGATADNYLLSLPAMRGQDTVPGLAADVRQDMARR
jgi:hypothetical protein